MWQRGLGCLVILLLMTPGLCGRVDGLVMFEIRGLGVPSRKFTSPLEEACSRLPLRMQWNLC